MCVPKVYSVEVEQWLPEAGGEGIRKLLFNGKFGKMKKIPEMGDGARIITVNALSAAELCALKWKMISSMLCVFYHDF